MKNSKGFTLVELMAVLVILALIATLAFPNFSKLTENAKSNYDVSTKIMLKNAARMYVTNNTAEVEKYLQNNGSSYCLPVGKLVAYEYLDSEIDLKDKDGNPVEDNACIVITKSGKTYQYDTSLVQKADGDYRPPVITITGTGCKSVMSVNSYTDFDNNCTVKAVDNINTNTKIFKPIKEKETDSNLSKVVVQENNKIFITYSATDSANNKSVPLQVQLTLPE